MQKQVLREGWLFWKEGHETDAVSVQVPHDAMQTEERDPNLENGNASGFYPGGKYFYRRELDISEAERDGTLVLEFEGVYMDSSIYLNGEKIGGHYYGYTDFRIDISGNVQPGKNELLVVADNSKVPNSRWYSGAGIYRPVNLYIGEKEYLTPGGLRVTTESIQPARLHFAAEAEKMPDTELRISILSEGKKVASFTRNSGETAADGLYDLGSCEIPDARLWSADQPYLYEIRADLLRGEKVLDSESIFYGIRKLEWNARDGFMVNGKTVKLKGGCVHHDNGLLGAATWDDAEYRRLKKMKELGYNAVRYSHNPAGKNFLNLCDRLGLYVIDESSDQWKIPQSRFDYATHFDEEWRADLDALIRKDYNHPSVIMYCVGNEITDTGLPHGAALCRMLCAYVKERDATRPTMLAVNSMLCVLADMQVKNAQAGEKGQTGSKDANDIVALLPKIMESITPESLESLIGETLEAIDIVGYNYGENLYPGTHQLAPDRVILSSETFPANIGEHWPTVENNSHIIGDFMWTAWDYLGEAGVGLPFYGTDTAPFSKEYPCLSAGCGSIDLTGYVESQGRYTSVIFGAQSGPFLAVRPLNHAGEAYTVGRWRLTDAVDSWSWDGCEGRTTEIEVYSAGQEVELFQSRRTGEAISLGRKALENCRSGFTAVYQKGSLTAVSYDSDGKEIGRNSLRSADPADVKLRIDVEKADLHADKERLLYVNIQITDEAGITHMLKDSRISVQVEGVGKLLALGSANPETQEKFSDTSYTSYHGRLLAIIQSDGNSGEIRISATCEELQAAACTSIFME